VLSNRSAYPTRTAVELKPRSPFLISKALRRLRLALQRHLEILLDSLTQVVAANVSSL